MSGEVDDRSRREFLKKAGTVAWIVPTMQVVNMASAMGQTTGSVVTMPPSTPPPPPECQCKLDVIDWAVNDNGVAYKVALSHDCEGADNVTLNVGDSSTNVGMQDVYTIETPTRDTYDLRVEVHDNQGRILATCHIVLELPG